MLNICFKCKGYSVEKEISEDGKLMTCPFCGYTQEIKRMPLFIITGASGVGKTSISAQLFLKEKNYIVLERDILWNNAFINPDNDNNEYSELWLRMCKNISQIGKSVVLCGCSTPQEFDNCLERRYFSEIYYLTVVCDNDILLMRLTEYRNVKSQEWIDSSISFNEWLKDNAQKTTPKMHIFDNSHISIEESAKVVDDWILKILN
jgi:adenylate kinase family enzyme